jgi:hypothetical protein
MADSFQKDHLLDKDGRGGVSSCKCGSQVQAAPSHLQAHHKSLKGMLIAKSVRFGNDRTEAGKGACPP